MRKSSVLLGVMVFGTFCATAWWQWRAMDAPLATAVPPAARQGPQGEQLSAADAFAAQSARAPPAASSASLALPADRADAGSSPKKINRDEDLRRMRDSMEQNETRRRDDPEFRKRQDEGQRQFAERTRAEAMRVAHMSPEQVDRMFEYAAERSKRTRELIADSQGRPSEEVFAEIGRLNDRYDEQLKDLLEREQYERWDWYHASQAQRNEARSFQRQLARTGVQSMEPEQVDGLVDALYVEERRWEDEYQQYVRSTGISDPDKVPPRSNEWQLASGKARNKRIHDAMAGSLTPQQMASLDEMLGKKLEYLENAISYNGSLAK